VTRPRSGEVRDGATLDTASNGTTVGRTVRADSPDPVSDGPVRTCIGCRRTASRSVLVRIVGAEVEGRLTAVPDPAAVRPGRGAWLHRDRGCVELAERRKAFARALRLAGPVDTTAVHRFLTEPRDEHEPTARPDNRKRVDEV
jgi:uncharacterized protein